MENYDIPTNYPANINFLSVGEEKCAPGHFNGPKIRDYYLFHYIISGEGLYVYNNVTYHLKENQGFLIPDSSVIFYKADEFNPWHYCWIYFTGADAKKIVDALSMSKEHPIYTAQSENNIYTSFKDLMLTMKHNSHNPIQVASCFYNYIFELQKSNIIQNAKIDNKSESYTNKAVNYIISRFSSPDFKIQDIAKSINIDRSYLTRLFTEKYNQSPQEFLINYRMQQAKKLLETTDYSITIISYSVGYPDVYSFSKTFKSFYKISPTEARNNSKI